ncbi:MAG: hypothetical protein CVV51_14930 [Spirochaetae bacterium HGW-Spirochaetae-7]|jgi:positive regulator of sigma E activity|nr:MAG: hypothetical protein CVV51_14930 [Spirochaetae bacterium HGW-Spirochaetae-7]
MKEPGTATKVDGNAVTVLIGMSEGCASCNSHDGCGIAGREIQAEAAAGENIAVGDAVVLDVPDSANAAGALWLLVVPVGLFFAGYLGVGAAWPSSSEGVQALAGLACLAAGLLFAATVARRGRMSRRPLATLVAKS